MKGLRKYIAPFAPDQSGASGVLCEMKGMILILDAGGCAGNICGFDEPRWFGSRSQIFSAGLRDMDAILGRDDLLVEKVIKASRRIRSEFIALIGTPVPAVIATDYKALKRMLEKRTGLPVLTIDTNGTELYDIGASKAWMALAETFPEGNRAGMQSEGREPATSSKTLEEGTLSVGVLGLSPLELGTAAESRPAGHFQDKALECLKGEGMSEADCSALRIHCYGMGAGVEECKHIDNNKYNIVASPSGWKAARYLKEKWGTPFVVWCPPDLIPEGGQLINAWRQSRRESGGSSFCDIDLADCRKVLILHQQVYANSLRQELEKISDASFTVASWFSMDQSLMRDRDFRVREEDEWQEKIREGEYDLIVADDLFRRALPDYRGMWWNLPHFAVSGKRGSL